MKLLLGALILVVVVVAVNAALTQPAPQLRVMQGGR